MAHRVTVSARVKRLTSVLCDVEPCNGQGTENHTMICDGVLCDGCLWKNGLHRVTNGSLCFADNPKFLIADSGDDDNVKAGLARLSYPTFIILS